MKAHKPTESERIAATKRPVNSMPLMDQKWRNLLFLHWEYDADEIQKRLPDGLHVDTYNGKAYVSLTPFFLKDVRLKMMPAIPGMSDFLEMNLRTYVYDDQGVPGVWFYSLDANSFLGVQSARTFFYLPYFYADMEAEVNKKGEFHFTTRRQETGVTSEFIYRGMEKQLTAAPDSLDFFLIERYALFADKGDNQLMRGRIHHAPYPLYEAEVSKWDDLVFGQTGLPRPERQPDRMHFSPGVNVEIFALQDVHG